jgi:hypothetical protein
MKIDVTALGLGRLMLGYADALGQHELLQASSQDQIVALQETIKQLTAEVAALKPKADGQPGV